MSKRKPIAIRRIRKTALWALSVAAAIVMMSATGALPAQARILACFYDAAGQYTGADGCRAGMGVHPPCTETSGAVCEVRSSGTCRESGDDDYASYYVIEGQDGNDCPRQLPVFWTDDGTEPLGFNDACPEAGEMKEAVFVNFQRKLMSSGGPAGSDGEMLWCVTSPEYGVVNGTFGSGGSVKEMAIDGPAKAMRGTPGWSLGDQGGDLEFSWDDAHNMFVGKWRLGQGSPDDPWNEGWQAVPID